MIFKLKEKLFSKKMLPYYILIMITILIGFPLLKLEAINGHDSIFHLFRNYTTKVALEDGQLIPMINPYMLGGLGYGVNIFYGVLSTYIVNIIDIFSPTFGLSINLFTILTLFLSGLFMYQFVYQIYQNKITATISAVLYIMSPYHLYDVYVRGALGELMAFVFIPLLFHGLYNLLYQNQKKWYLITIGTAGLLLSHNISTFIIMIFAIVYLLINYKKVLNKKVITTIIISLSLALFIALPTIIPLLEANISSDYMVFDSKYMNTTISSMMKHSIKLLNFNNLSSMFYIYILIFITSLIIYELNKKSKDYQFLILSFLSIILILNIIPWNILPSIFLKIQFPWRFFLPLSFFLSISFSSVITSAIKKFKTKGIILFIVVCMVISIPYLVCGIKDDGIPDSLLSSNRIKLRDNIARSTGSASAEYLPRNAIYNYEYLKTRKKIPIVLEGNSLISNHKKEGTYIAFNIDVKEDTIIELPYIYYPGYNVKKDGNSITTFETTNGLVGIKLVKGNYFIESKYRGTNNMLVSYNISFISLMILVVIIIRSKRVNCQYKASNYSYNGVK